MELPPKCTEVHLLHFEAVLRWGFQTRVYFFPMFHQGGVLVHSSKILCMFFSSFKESSVGLSPIVGLHSSLLTCLALDSVRHIPLFALPWLLFAPSAAFPATVAPLPGGWIGQELLNGASKPFYHSDFASISILPPQLFSLLDFLFEPTARGLGHI